MRISSDSSLHIELIKDFYWDFHLYENFDGPPAAVHAPETILASPPDLAGSSRFSAFFNQIASRPLH